MTTGNSSWGGQTDFSAYGFKTFIGADGKFETVNGRKRVKWNTYTMSYYERSSQQGQNNNLVKGTGTGAADWPPEAEFALQSNLAKKVKGHKFNLAVSAAQGKQVVDLCVNTIRKFTASLVLMKRGRFGDALRQLGARPKKGVKDVSSNRVTADDLSKRWLESQYGWGPLLSDCYEASTAYEFITRIRRDTVRSGYEYWNPKTNWAASPTLYVFEGRRITTTYIRYEMEEAISGYRSLGLTDPASLVWELIPFSFVFDWFLPVGTYLENLNVIPSLRGRFLQTRVGEYSAGFVADLTSNHIFTPTSRVEYGKTVQRFAPTTALNVQLPSFVSLPAAMSPRRIYSAVALAHQAVRKLVS